MSHTSQQDNKNKNLIIILAGPTAVGKSSVAAHICELQKGMVISADSVQAYKGVQIGANKPTAEELAKTPHVLVSLIDASKEYNAAEWRRNALYSICQFLQIPLPTSDGVESIHPDEIQRQDCIDKIIQQARLDKNFNKDDKITPVIVGGTMMYLQWLVHGRPDAQRPSPSAVMQAKETMANFESKQDWKGAVQYVSNMGPIFQARIETLSGQDWYRLRRTLEVACTVLDDSHDKQQEKIESLYSGEREGGLQELLSDCDVRCFFLCPDNRMNHTALVDGRCEEMILKGVLQETASLHLKGELPEMARRAIGYRQALEYLLRDNFVPKDNKVLELFLEQFATATRRYAKKQMQWFRRDDEFFFVPVPLDQSNRIVETARTILDLCSLSRHDYQEELHNPNGMSAQTKRINEEQGKGMKFYQHASKHLKANTPEFNQVLKVADECTRRIRQEPPNPGESKEETQN